MKRSIGYTALVVVAAFAAFGAARAQQADVVRVVRSDAHQLVLQITPRLTLTKLPGGELLPRTPGAAVIANTGRTGQPMQLRVAVAVALPRLQGNTVEVIAQEYGQPVSGAIAPVPGIRYSSDGMPTEIYKADPVAYAVPDQSPLAQLANPGIARDVYAATLLVAPYTYNTTARTISVLKSATVRIRFASGVNAGQSTGGQISPMSQRAFINAGVASAWAIDPAQPARGLPSKPAAAAAAKAWMRVEVKEEGLYQLTAEDFTKAGIDLATVQNVAVYGGGGDDLPEAVASADTNRMRQMGTVIERDGAGRITAVLFYGVGPFRWKYANTTDTVPTHISSPYVTANSYIVAVDGDASKDFAVKTPPSAAPDINLNRGLARVFLDEDKVNAIGVAGRGGSGRDWFGTSFQPNDTRTFLTPLPGLDHAGMVNYRIRLAHTSGQSGTFASSQNDASLGPVVILPAVPTDPSAEATANARDVFYYGTGASVPSDNRSVLKINYQTQGQGQGFLDWFDIHYSRQLTADNGQLVFQAPSGSGVGQFTATGFSTSTIIGLDVTDPAFPVRLSPASATGGSFVFRDLMDINPRNGRRYFLTDRNAAKRVSAVFKASFGDLRNRMLNADVLVIMHPDFRSVAESYVSYRNTQGRVKAVAVPVDEIYTEFSHGNLDPTALRDYIAFAMKNWARKPSAVLLMGDANYDYRNIATRQKPLVPVYYGEDGDSYTSIASIPIDDYFVRVRGEDGRPDLAVGRFTVETPEQAAMVVDKVKRYEASAYYGNWRQTINLVADDAWSDGTDRSSDDFMTQSEELWRDILPDWIEANKLYLSLYPVVQTTARRKPAATDALQVALQRGAVITNWIGHGNPNVWAHEYVLQKDQFIPALTNDSALTFVVAATCNFGYYDDPSTVSGAEMFLLNPSGGAVAVMSSSRGSYIAENRTLMLAYYREIFRRDSLTRQYPSVGTALYVAKQVGSGSVSNDQKYLVLGDPALMLNLPKDSVAITSVNSRPATDTVTVRALSQVTVEGRILDHTGTPRNDFNGIAIVTLYDADRHMVINEDFVAQSLTLYGGQLFRGPSVVTNGRFTATFRVPKDIAYDSALARIHVYAYNQSGDASGMSSRIRVFGLDTVSITDRSGPVIKAFLDDRSFRSGDVVTNKPLMIVDLSDSSGVNSSGSGLGHRIEAWVDKSPGSLDLTESYRTLPTDYRQGSAERRLDSLTPGLHTLRVRAWDIFNNVAEQTVTFLVADSPTGTLDVAEVVNFPNPMTKSTSFTFRHNQTKPLNVQITIYSTGGRRVRQLTLRNTTDRFVRVPWDGTDDDGDPLANGVYLYRLTVDVAGGTGDNQHFETIEKVAVGR